MTAPVVQAHRRAVDYRLISRYEIAGGHLNGTALGAGPQSFPTEEA